MILEFPFFPIQPLFKSSNIISVSPLAEILPGMKERLYKIRSVILSGQQCSQRGSPSVLGQDEDGRHFVVPSRLFQNFPDKLEQRTRTDDIVSSPTVPHRPPPSPTVPRRLPMFSDVFRCFPMFSDVFRRPLPSPAVPCRPLPSPIVPGGPM